LATVAANGLILINPYILKITFDKIEMGGELKDVLFYALLMVGIAIVAGAFRFAMRRTIIWMSRRIEYDIRSNLFSHLLKLDQTFYNNSRTGDIMARSTNDIEAVRMMIGPGIMQIANAIIKGVIGISFMFYLSPKLTLYSLLPLPILSLVVNRLGALVHKKFAKIQEYFAVLTSRVQENLAGVRVIRAYNQEKPAINDFDKHNRKYIDLNVQMIKVMCLFYPLMFMLAGTVNLVILYFGGREVIADNISLGTLMAFFAYLTLLIWPMIAMGWVVSLYQRGTASLDRINKILNTQPNVKTSPNDRRHYRTYSVRQDNSGLANYSYVSGRTGHAFY
jgi:ATP-binding cassette subfamily B protein